MEILPFVGESDLEAASAAMCEIFEREGVALLPTETFYGLAANPFSRSAVDRVFALKDRPADLSLPILAGSWAQVDRLVNVPKDHRRQLEAWWPGPVTAVLEVKKGLAACRGKTAAVRITGHRLLRRLLENSGPVTGTSANRHGAEPVVTCAAALHSMVGRPDLVLDGGSAPGGAASTIVDMTQSDVKVLRGDPRFLTRKSVSHRA